MTDHLLAQCRGNLIFRDEFDGTSLDGTKWTIETGNGCPNLCGWGNNEKEYYTDLTQNVSVSGGYLNLTARYSPAYATGSDFTSGKINSKGKFDRTYGRFEAKMKLPSGTGLWPAFWMLPTSNVYGGWPTSGEIDIMENRGDQNNIVGSTLHYGSAFPNNQYDATSYTLTNGSFMNSFHEYAVEWEPGKMHFYVDGFLVKTETQNPNTLNPASNNSVTWPWDQQFYIILNLAVGGWYSGDPSTSQITAATTFPQSLQVDYVRVYDMSPSATQITYLNNVPDIPGTIEAENYNEGCNGYAYNDSDLGNTGGQYRSDGVDIEACTDAGGGYDVGWSAAGEWLNYNVNVIAESTYDFKVRVASNVTGKSMHIEMDGVNVTGSIAVPNTGGWQNWQTVTVSSINLTAGAKLMKVVFDTDGINLNNVTITSQNQIPTVSITSPATNTVFSAPGSITINASATDADGTIAKVEFYNGNTLLGTSTSSPYTYSWTNVAAGTYSISAKATDNGGMIGSSSLVKVIVRGPYSGAAWTIPGKIEVEGYDIGGPGVTYSDSDLGNTGSIYRTDDVDIEATSDAGGGYDVGWTAAGEWLEYTVNVSSSGSYNFGIRAATTTSGNTVRIEMDGTDITGSISLPNSGGWQNWQTTTSSNVNLTQGTHKMRIVMETGGLNFNYVDVEASSAMGVTQPNSLASWQVYPNPMGDMIQIQFDQPLNGPAKIMLTDMQGKTIRVWSDGTNYSGQSNLSFNSSDIEPGFYLLKLETQEGNAVRKVSK